MFPWGERVTGGSGMKKTASVSKIVELDYRLTRTGDGLWIEVLDYHAEPLFLGHAKLAEFDLAPCGTSAGRSASGGLEETLASLERRMRSVEEQNAAIERTLVKLTSIATQSGKRKRRKVASQPSLFNE